MGKNKFKKNYYANKHNVEMHNTKNVCSLSEDNLFRELLKRDNIDLDINKIDLITNNDIHDKLETLHDKLEEMANGFSHYIKSNKKWNYIRIGGGISIGLISLSLFFYGKIKFEQLMVMLKALGSVVGIF